jgi:hypothetical protein
MPDVPVRNIWKHAFWTDKTPSEVTLFRFVGEFKHTVSARNLNQLLMDFASGQCQLRALGIRSIIWGATCSSGVVEVYSSEWNINLSVNNVSSFVLVHLAYLQLECCGLSSRSVELNQPGRISEILFVPLQPRHSGWFCLI